MKSTLVMLVIILTTLSIVFLMQVIRYGHKNRVSGHRFVAHHKRWITVFVVTMMVNVVAIETLRHFYTTTRALEPVHLGIVLVMLLSLLISLKWNGKRYKKVHHIFVWVFVSAYVATCVTGGKLLYAIAATSH